VRYSQDCSRIGAVVTSQGLFDALGDDLEAMPFEVFAFRVRRILKDDLRCVLSRPWTELDWHVETYPPEPSRRRQKAPLPLLMPAEVILALQLRGVW
jgi:hypothetical protein